MRFAIKIAPQHTTWSDMLAVFRAADDVELFESGWTFDHFYPIFSDPGGPCLEGWTTITALAQATKRLRLGVMVSGNVYRHPAVLANVAATADIVSGGRLELGLGAGWNQQECDAYGIDLPPLGERFDRFEEAVAVVAGLLTNETTNFEGKHYRLREARCEPKPLQRPHPPICIGGAGERRTLPIVARWAQHWNFPLGEPQVFAHKLEVLIGHCDAIGRDPAEIVTSTQVFLRPGVEPPALADAVAAFAEAGCDLAVVALAPPHSPRILDSLAEALVPLATG